MNTLKQTFLPISYYLSPNTSASQYNRHGHGAGARAGRVVAAGGQRDARHGGRLRAPRGPGVAPGRARGGTHVRRARHAAGRARAHAAAQHEAHA